MPTRRLPSDPNLEHLKNQAKALHQRVRSGDADAVELVREFHPRAAEPSEIKRSDAQLTIARMYGFASWRRLRSHVATVAQHSRSLREAAVQDDGDLTNRFLRLACLNYSTDSPDRRQAARELLGLHPELS